MKLPANILGMALMLVPVKAFPVAGDAGQPGSFLRAGVGARALGMGNAFTAVADDASAAYWNPAGLALSDRPSFGSMVSLLSLSRRHNYASITWPVGMTPANQEQRGSVFPSSGAWGGWGQWGFSWINFSLGNDFEARSADTAQVEGYFGDEQHAYLLTHSRALASWLSVGINAKYFYRRLADFSASGGGMDAGLLMLVHRHLRVGLTVGDLLSGQVWQTGFSERFPTVTRVGVASPWLDGALTALLDVQGVEGQQPRIRAGLEGWFLKTLGGRVGWNENGFTAGGSVRVRAFSTDLRLDYGLGSDPLQIGQVQQFSLFLAF